MLYSGLLKTIKNSSNLVFQNRIEDRYLGKGDSLKRGASQAYSHIAYYLKRTTLPSDCQVIENNPDSQHFFLYLQKN